MECVFNGLNLVAAPDVAGAARQARPPAKRQRWQPADIEFLFTGRAAFRKLDRIVAELSRTADESSDVVVVLLPQNLVVRRIEYSEATTTFVCDVRGRAKTVEIPNGQPFGAFIEVVPKRNHFQLVTRFVDRLLHGHEPSSAKTVPA